MKHIKLFEEFVDDNKIVSIVVEALKAKKPNDEIEIDIDFAGDDNDLKKLSKKHNLEADEYEAGMVMLKGKKKDLLAYLQSDEYGMEEEDIKDLFPELLENSLNEGNHDGFVIMDGKTGKKYKFHYTGGNDTKTENEALAKLTKATGTPKKQFFFTTMIGKGEWDKTDAEVLESVEESSVNAGKAPRSWDSMFAMNVIKAFKAGEIDPNDPKSIEKWNTDYNGGLKPKPDFETGAIIKYYQETGKGPDGKP